MDVAEQLGHVIIGFRGQIGRDVCAYFTARQINFEAISIRLQTSQDVGDLVASYPRHQVINLAFDKTLQDCFTNVELPRLLDLYCDRPPVHVSSNAVYGIASRRAGSSDSVDGFNAYARKKIDAETKLQNSIIIRGSFLAQTHRLFCDPDPRINKYSLWNGVTTFEFARLLLGNAFQLGINTVASQQVLTWQEIADAFDVSATHDANLINNRCVLLSDVAQVRDLQCQLAELRNTISSD